VYRFSNNSPYNEKNIPLTCNSCIIESYCIEDVLKYAKDSSAIVVFDLDNTIVYPGQDLGSEQWFGYMLNQKLAAGMNRQDALAEVLPIYYKVHDHISLQPVEPSSATTISMLQKKGITTLALTSRSLPLIERTKAQLKELGISFTCSEEFNKELSIALEKQAILSNGIIFCNDNNKGKTLIKTLQTCNCRPATIVFVDDKLHHVLDVEKECLLNNIHFVGIRYGKLDAVAAQFDPKRAEQQYTALFNAIA
jgi:3-deoxy-D-manno-octulosonate 8-phosphate phosphatase KdsC-like HAD superfamily phosphatase